MQRHDGQISRTVLLVAIGVLIDRAIQSAQRSRPFFLEAARKLAALRLGERHLISPLLNGDAYLRPRHGSPTLTNPRSFARFVL